MSSAGYDAGMRASRLLGIFMAALIMLAIGVATVTWLLSNRGLSESDAIKHCNIAIFEDLASADGDPQTGRTLSDGWQVYGQTTDGEAFYCSMADSQDPSVQYWLGDQAQSFIDKHAN